jgi:hypothetical protein
MAKPNYSFEKRQRDLAKKAKKEEKQEEKRLRKAGTSANPETPEPAAAPPVTELKTPS